MISPNKLESGVRRLSISLPERLSFELDEMVAKKGFKHRSQAVAELISSRLNQESQQEPNTVMAGTLTLVYDESKRGLLAKIARILRENLTEIISSQHIMLEDNFVMEVMLMQGPVDTLQKIADKLRTCKGVASGQLALTTKLLPPLHKSSQ
jgi:CopG family nickel-responsive transcriptional regulator